MRRVLEVLPTGGRIIRAIGQQWVAIENFVDPTDGTLVEAGVTVCSDEADVVRMFPDRFVPWSGDLAELDRIKRGIHRSRDHTPAPAREPAEIRVPALDMKNLSPVKVRVAPTAHARMLDELFHLTRNDGCEAGGFLFGNPTRSFDKQVRVMIATPTGDAERGTHAMSLDGNMARSAEASIARGRLDDTLLGIWHSHPNTRDTDPSDADLAALQRVLDIHEERGRHAAYAVQLIFAASPAFGDTWARPRCEAWVLRSRPYGAQPVCERAEVRPLY